VREKTLEERQLDRAVGVTNLFLTLLGEWNVHIGTRFWKPKHFWPRKVTLQVSLIGSLGPNLRSDLVATTLETLGMDREPSFRLCYYAGKWPFLRGAEIPVHELSTHLCRSRFAKDPVAVRSWPSELNPTTDIDIEELESFVERSSGDLDTTVVESGKDPETIAESDKDLLNIAEDENSLKTMMERYKALRDALIDDVRQRQSYYAADFEEALRSDWRAGTPNPYM